MTYFPAFCPVCHMYLGLIDPQTGLPLMPMPHLPGCVYAPDEDDDGAA